MKKLLTLTTIVATSVVLSGCSSPNYTWYKSGVSRDEMRTYYRQCEYDMGMNKVSPEKENRLMRACMEKAGFRWVRR